jgi:hypothetical protein
MKFFRLAVIIAACGLVFNLFYYRLTSEAGTTNQSNTPPTLRAEPPMPPEVEVPDESQKTHLPVTISIESSIPSDPWQTLQISAASNGQVVYAHFTDDPYRRVLTVRKIRDGKITSVQAFVVNGGDVDDRVFDPQFSHDSRYISFKMGWPYAEENYYHLLVWDTTSNKVIVVAPELSFPTVQWSNDDRYLSYIRGGTASGAVNLGEQLHLCVYDFKDNRERSIPTDSFVKYSFGWGLKDVLYYVSENTKKETSAENLESIAAWPEIVAWNIATGKKEIVVKSGYRPSVSPDGNQIAFFGPENISKVAKMRDDWEYRPYYATLLIKDNNTDSRKAINQIKNNYPEVFWTLDSRHILTLQSSYNEKLTNKPAIGHAIIEEWDVKSGIRRQVSTLTISDFEPIPRPIMQPQFNGIGMSRDGKKFIVKVSEIKGVDEPFYKEIVSIHSVDLKNGKNDIIASISSSMGVDWYDESAPIPPKAAKPQ